MVSSNRATITDNTDRVVATSELQTIGTHAVRMTVTPQQTTIWVDGNAIATVPSNDGRGVFSVIGSRNTAAQPFAAWTYLRISPM